MLKRRRSSKQISVAGEAEGKSSDTFKPKSLKEKAAAGLSVIKIGGNSGGGERSLFS